MTFTNATDQGGRDQGESFVCSEVLTFPDAGATTCYFATASQIVADASPPRRDSRGHECCSTLRKAQEGM